MMAAPEFALDGPWANGAARRMSPHYTAEHEAFRAAMRRFMDREVMPFIDGWDEAETFPRELYRKAGEIGLLGLLFPEVHGGTPGDHFHLLVATEELCRAGSGGLLASLLSHNIAAPPIAAMATEAMKARILPAVLAGEKIMALAVTEPSGGSDVASLKCRAARVGDDYVVRGEKCFITSGLRADYLTVAVRTGGAGMAGVSLLLVEGDRPGLTRVPMKKMGWWCSDTAHLFFDDVRVPVSNLIGPPEGGFIGLMQNFNGERFRLSSGCYGFSRTCLEEAITYARQRETFGKTLSRHQVVRHKLVEMAMRIEALRAQLESLAWRLDRGDQPVAEMAMLKASATDCFEFVAGQAVQILGGAGYMRPSKVERCFRETKVMSIGGGATEIMKDLAARQMGL